MIQKNSLVLYKSAPAIVLSSGAKIEIELPDKKRVSVRDKDISLLHEGPLAKLSDIEDTPAGEIDEACSMMSGETTTLPELSDLIYGTFTPASAWAICKLLFDNILITGTPEKITVRTADEIQKLLAERNQKNAEKDAWNAFIERVRKNAIVADDRPRLAQLEDVAFGKSTTCRILKELSLQDSAVTAHSLLLKLGVWDYTVNPCIKRSGLTTETTYPPIDAIPDEPRVDLTGLAAYAIDDEGNRDPDDAISIDGNRLWVHIADPSSVITPDSPADLHARELATTLYLPEKHVTMLPPQATDLFGLGLQTTSPALSFGIDLNDDGSIGTYEIVLSTIKVTRLTYAEAQAKIDDEPFCSIYQMTKKYREYRKAANAAFISFPEVKIRVADNVVTITPLPGMDSKELVTDCMVMAGETAARFASANSIPFPYTSQPPPETIENPTDYASMFSYRKKLQPGTVKCTPDIHAGLGVKLYSRATSPLRRYLDLVVHQQLRAFICGKPLLDEQAILNRIGTSASVTGTAALLERQSNLHWTLVYLHQHPDWQGDAIVIEKRERFSIILIPELALEARISEKNVILNQQLRVKVNGIDLAEQMVFLSIV
jgi:exoribonuclease-2